MSRRWIHNLNDAMVCPAPSGVDAEDQSMPAPTPRCAQVWSRLWGLGHGLIGSLSLTILVVRHCVVLGQGRQLQMPNNKRRQLPTLQSALKNQLPAKQRQLSQRKRPASNTNDESPVCGWSTVRQGNRWADRCVEQHAALPTGPLPDWQKAECCGQ